MPPRRPPRVLKKEYRQAAFDALDKIIDVAQQVSGDAADRRDFLSREVDADLLSDIDPDVAQPAPAQIDCLRSFLTFAKEADLVGLKWSTVQGYLFPKHPCNDRTLQLVSHLLRPPDVEALTTLTSSPSTAADPHASTGGLLIDWHERIDDHRQVILGQLPRANSFPAVFVFSADRKQWYPQHDLVRLGEPGGLAFVCNARFGNPHGIGHVPPPDEDKFPWKGKVRVYALASKPKKDEKIPAVLTDDELKKWVERFGEADSKEIPVTRDWPLIASIVVEGDRNRAAWTFRPPECVRRSFPLNLSWQTHGTVFYEIRKAPTDEVVVPDGSVRGELKMQIVDKASTEPVPPGVRRVGLPGVGIYRLRYWGMRKSFLDQETELWFEITPRQGATPRKPARDRTSRRTVVSVRR